MKANIEQNGERRQSYEETQARLAKVEGINLIGDFEQRRSGWCTSGNKAACFLCGNTENFKAHRPIWIKKKKKWAGDRPTTNAKGGQKVRKEKEKGNRPIFLVWETQNWAQKREKYRRMG